MTAKQAINSSYLKRQRSDLLRSLIESNKQIEEMFLSASKQSSYFHVMRTKIAQSQQDQGGPQNNIRARDLSTFLINSDWLCHLRWHIAIDEKQIPCKIHFA